MYARVRSEKGEIGHSFQCFQGGRCVCCFLYEKAVYWASSSDPARDYQSIKQPEWVDGSSRHLDCSRHSIFCRLLLSNGNDGHFDHLIAWQLDRRLGRLFTRLHFLRWKLFAFNESSLFGFCSVMPGRPKSNNPFSFFSRFLLSCRYTQP